MLTSREISDMHHEHTSGSKPKMRTRSEVLAARNTMNGCCAMYCDRMGCSCLAEACPDDYKKEPNLLEQCEHGQRESTCLLCISMRADGRKQETTEETRKCEHGVNLSCYCEKCTAGYQAAAGLRAKQAEGAAPLDHASFFNACGEIERMCAKIDQPPSISVARRLALMHLAQDLVRWLEARGVQMHEAPLLRRMVDLLLEAE